MSNLPKFPSGHNTHIILPSLSQIASNSSFPAYLRMVAMDLARESYATVGSILSNMSPQDAASVLTSWLNQLGNALAERDNQSGEDGDNEVILISSPSTFSFLLFTSLVARAESGEVKLDPIMAGVQTELMSTFLRAIVLQNMHDRVTVDLTKFTLNPDFLDQNFDQVISTDNFKAIKDVNEVKAVWNKLKKSEVVATVRKPAEPKKEELIRAPASVSRFSKQARTETKVDLNLDLPSPSSEASLGDLEAKLRRLSGG